MAQASNSAIQMVPESDLEEKILYLLAASGKAIDPETPEGVSLILVRTRAFAAADIKHINVRQAVRDLIARVQYLEGVCDGAAQLLHDHMDVATRCNMYDEICSVLDEVEKVRTGRDLWQKNVGLKKEKHYEPQTS